MIINGKISPRMLAEEHGGEVQTFSAIAEAKS
jgi:hypothetical protein